MARQTLNFVNHRFQHNGQRGRSPRHFAAGRFDQLCRTQKQSDRAHQEPSINQWMCLFITRAENDPIGLLTIEAKLRQTSANFVIQKCRCTQIIHQ